MQDKDGKNFANIVKADSSGLYVLGTTRSEVAAKVEYSIRIGGLRNPRFLINSNTNPGISDFEISTFDSDGYDPDKNLIDNGKGGPFDISKLSQIESFSAEAYNTTNGVSTKYFVTWTTDILTQNKDILIVNFPKQVVFSPLVSQ